MIRDGGELREVSWERALDEAASGLKRANGRVGAIAGGTTTNEEGFLLQRLMREGLSSPDLVRECSASRRNLDRLFAIQDPDTH